MIKLKSKHEIKLMAKAGEIAGFALKQVIKELRPGITTLELDKIAKRVIESRGAEAAFLGYNGYEYSICISINEQLVHGIPSSRKIKAGDLVGIDLGVKYKGFCADTAKTVFVSNASSEVKQLINGVKEALYEAIKMARSGNTVGDIENKTGEVLKKYSLSPVMALSGHGIGVSVHEEPAIKSSGRAGSGERIKTGMVFAIEPMAALSSGEVKTGKDGWTISTRDSSLTAHFEHTVAVTEKGPRILTGV
jgi:methionyl aminopeptidase